MVHILGPYEQLQAAAVALNRASDDLGEQVKLIDESLKKLNLGIEAWVPATPPLSLGYARVGSRWGLALRCEVEEWLFNDAPRAWRIDAIRFFPSLIGQLTAVATDTVGEVTQGIQKLRVLEDEFARLKPEPGNRF